jgi:hypothetical protein
MPSQEELARQTIDALLPQCGGVCHARNVSRSQFRKGISTIQRLHSMLRFLFFRDRNTDATRRDQREETGSVFAVQLL